MPLYIYLCPECDIELEELRAAWRVDDPVECPICHGLCLRQVANIASPARQDPAPIRYASPEQVARAMHGPACSCCRPRRRS
ncbi:MAG: zinc ribbon domain-containing protein [Chloroflexia bacterium]|nr:zinc ribbon domain-containing protein [Chloroflexia bacterium]